MQVAALPQLSSFRYVIPYFFLRSAGVVAGI